MIAIKLDENFPSTFTSFFSEKGIDASSVLLQEMSGTHDDNLYQICIDEERILVTFDLDFANIIRYPADKTMGIVICRIRQQISITDIKSICNKVINLLLARNIVGCLVVIDGDKIRIRKPSE